MKIECKDFQKEGRVAVLQFTTLNRELWEFYPGGPAVETGDLVIKELGEAGRVEELQVINNTNKYLFFMDTDILIGAKQNRVMNSSVLFAPRSHSVMSVSCVERGRWKSSSPKFKMSNHHIEPDIRKHKAKILKQDPAERRASAAKFQYEVWDQVAGKNKEVTVDNPTEDYERVLYKKAEMKDPEPFQFTLNKEANGMAVLVNDIIVSVDLFGSNPVYEHYFPRLIRNIDYELKHGKMPDLTEKKAVKLVDKYISKQGSTRSRFYTAKNGVGEIRQIESKHSAGAELVFDKRIVHTFILSQ